MSTAKPPPLLWLQYEEAAQAYERSLPPEHYMEAIGQSTQRKITLESLDLVHARRPEVQVFSELLVLYPYGRGAKIHGVVPDNMVVLSEEPVQARGSYNLPFEPCGPFWVLEYVSKYNKRKDYEDNFRRYERALKVPYFLLFQPEAHDLKLYRHTGKKYALVRPNAHGRLAVRELELEVALLASWVRFWYQGQLLPLPADLLRELDETRGQLAQANRRADEQTHRADEQTHRANEQTRRADEEQRARLVAEEEIARLRAQLEQARSGPRKTS